MRGNHPLRPGPSLSSIIKKKKHKIESDGQQMCLEGKRENREFLPRDLRRFADQPSWSYYKLTGTKKEQWTLLGNTIPTIFTRIIGKQILKHLPMLGRNG